MEIHFATWLYEKAQGQALTNTGADHRLLSHFFLVEGGVNKDQLKEYVHTGNLDYKKVKK